MSRYEEMWNMPHPVSKKHPQMSLHDRAAQFSPFAALTGHEAAVQEEARMTEQRIELDDSERAQLSERLQELMTRYNGHPEVTVTWFCPDEKKEGGAYVTENGRVRKVDLIRRILQFEDRQEIALDQIIKIEEKRSDEPC